MLHHLGQCGLAVQAAEGERETRACRRQRLESERRQHASGACIPRIWDDEGLAGMQCPKLEGLLLLSVHGLTLAAKLRGLWRCGRDGRNAHIAP